MGNESEQPILHSSHEHPTRHWELLRHDRAIRGIDPRMCQRHWRRQGLGQYLDLRSVMPTTTFSTTTGIPRSRPTSTSPIPHSTSPIGVASGWKKTRWQYGAPPAENVGPAGVQRFIHDMAPRGRRLTAREWRMNVCDGCLL